MTRKNKLNFIKEKRDINEDYEHFWERLQNQVDKGEIIVGTYKDNHVFMIVAGGSYKVIDNISHVENGYLINKYQLNPNINHGDKYGFTFAIENISNVPRIIECGETVKEANALI